MNAYIIKRKGRRYITNAENLMEAEDKFVEQLELDYSENDYKIEPVELTPRLQDDDSIMFF